MPINITTFGIDIKTPTEIDVDVKKLISIVCPGEVPVFLAVEPESYAQVIECFPAVAEKIRRDGGSQVLGWQIWKTNILIEAEFHAVWKSNEGVLKDITPKQLSISKILFLPDLKAAYDGSQIDNVRINISGNPLVDDFIKIAKAKFRIMNKGKRALEREIKLSGKEAAIFELLKKIQMGVYFMAKQGKTRNGSCFCGRPDKYKHCHGKKLVEILKNL